LAFSEPTLGTLRAVTLAHCSGQGDFVIWLIALRRDCWSPQPNAL